MSSTWLEDLDTEFAEYDDSEAGELYDEGEGEDYDAEARSAADRRRARQRRMALARRRQAQARGRTRPAGRLPARPSPQQAVSAIKNLDLETKVQEDAFRGAISAQSKRMSRSEYAAVAGAAVNQFIESFDAPDNAFAKAALRFAPLLLLSPQPRGKGLEALVKDPRVVGGAAVAAITIAGENRNRFSAAREVSVLSASELEVGQDDTFIADVLDGRGAVLNKPVSWSSSDPNIAAIDPASGRVTPIAPGVVVISASSEGIVRRVRLKVTGAAAGARGAK